MWGSGDRLHDIQIHGAGEGRARWCVAAVGRSGARSARRSQLRWGQAAMKCVSGGEARSTLEPVEHAGASCSHRAGDGAEVGSGRGGGPRRRCWRMVPRLEPAAAAPVAGKKHRLRRRGCSGSPRGEEALAPVAGKKKNQRLRQRQSTRGGYPARMRRRGGRTSGEEEERSLRVWSDVLAGGGGAKYSAWRGWMDRAVVKSSAQMDGRDRFG